MNVTIIVTDDRVDVLKDGYNIIERSVYDDELVIKAHKLVKQLTNQE